MEDQLENCPFHYKKHMTGILQINRLTNECSQSEQFQARCSLYIIPFTSIDVHSDRRSLILTVLSQIFPKPWIEYNSSEVDKQMRHSFVCSFTTFGKGAFAIVQFLETTKPGSNRTISLSIRNNLL